MCEYPGHSSCSWLFLVLTSHRPPLTVQLFAPSAITIRERLLPPGGNWALLIITSGERYKDERGQIDYKARGASVRKHLRRFSISPLPRVS